MTIDPDKYIEREMQISRAKLNLLSVPLTIVLILTIGQAYYLLWGEEIPNTFTIFTLIGVLVGVVLHELIHGVVAAKFAIKGWGSVSFGVKWKYLATYCHCQEPLSIRNFDALDCGFDCDDCQHFCRMGKYSNSVVSFICRWNR